MTKIRLSRALIARAGIAVIALLAVAVAVGSFETSSSDSGGAVGLKGADLSTEEPAEGRALGAPDAELFDGTTDDVGTPLIAQQELPFGDRIIRNAELTVEVEEDGFDAAWARAFDVAARLDGSVLTSSRGSGEIAPVRDDEAAFGSITVRVPSDRFEEALNAMRGLGDVRADRTTAQDVTEEFVDLSSRLRNLRAQEDALLRLMRKAESVQDTLLVQRELANTQAEIERITGRLNYLEARTEFSRITLTIAEPGALFVPHTTQTDGPSFAKAWDTAVVGLTRMATAALIALLWAAPFVVIAALVLWGLRRRPSPTPTP